MNIQTNELVPILPHDTVFASSADGLYVRRGSRRLMLRGASIADKFSTIAPQMKGHRSLHSLCSDYPESSREAMGKLVSQLIERRILLKRDDEDTAALPEPEREQFADQILFLSHFVDSPVRAFAQFRSKRVLLLGSGALQASAAIALLRNGLRKLHVNRDIKNLRGLSPDIVPFIDCGALTEVRGFHSENTLALYDIVCYAADLGSLSELRRFASACMGLGITFLPATVVAGAARIGPIHSHSGACWHCAMLRLADNAAPAEAAGLWRRIVTGAAAYSDVLHTSAPALAVAGTSLAFRLFKHATGISDPTDSDSAVLSISTLTLDSLSESLLPHPSCGFCSKRALPTPMPSPTADWHDWYAQADAKLLGPSFGVFYRFDDDELKQVPVFRTQLITRDNRNNLGPAILGNSIESNLDARVRALLAAATQYSADLYIDGITEILAYRDESETPEPLDDLPALHRFDLRSASFSDEPCLRDPLSAPPVGSLGIACGRSLSEAKASSRNALVARHFLRALSQRHASCAALDLHSNLRLALHFELLLSLSPAARVSTAQIDHTWVCLVLLEGETPTLVAGWGDSSDAAVLDALPEALSIASGGSSDRTVDRLFGIPSIQFPADSLVTTSGRHITLAGLLGRPEAMTYSWIYFDVTPPDIRQAGLTLVQAHVAFGE